MSVEFLEQALDRVATELASVDPETIEPYSGQWLDYQSLLHHQAKLLAELEAEQMESTVEMHLAGASVFGHFIDSSFFADVVTVFQKAVLAAAQVVMGAEQTDGTFPKSVRDVATLRLAPPVPGSFTAPLVAVDGGRVQQMELDGTEQPPVLDEALELIFSLLSDPGPGAGEELIEAAGRAGSRTTKLVITLTRRLVTDATGIRFVHRDVQQVTRTQTVRPALARRISEILEETQQQTEEIRVVGRLVGASWPRRTFELEVETDGEIQLYKGAVPTSLRREVAGGFDQTVDARLEVTRTFTQAGEERPTYRLIGLSTPGEPTLNDVDE